MSDPQISDSRPSWSGSSDTDELSISHESGLTHTFQSAGRDRDEEGPALLESEADIILIAHPDNHSPRSCRCRANMHGCATSAPR
jgi:hypothetical protein